MTPTRTTEGAMRSCSGLYRETSERYVSVTSSSVVTLCLGECWGADFTTFRTTRKKINWGRTG